MLPLVLPGALVELGGLQLGSPEFARWRDLMFYVPAIAGGDLRPARRVPHGPDRPPSGAGLEHPPLRALGLRRRVRDLAARAARPALPDLRGGLRRVRGRGGLARGALLRTQAAREGPRLHPGLFEPRRLHGEWRLHPALEVRRGPARDPRQPRAVALHLDLRPDPRHPAHADPPVPSRVAGLAASRRTRAP